MAFGIGDVIRQARKRKPGNWSQERLGIEAMRYTFGTPLKAIDKSTVSNIERGNFVTSEFGLVWRLIAAAGLTLADVEKNSGYPFTVLPVDAIEPQLSALRKQMVRAAPVSKRKHQKRRAR